MSQAANLLQYLGSHLDKLQEEHQKMQVEFRELKEQVNSIDERFLMILTVLILYRIILIRVKNS